MDRAFLEGLGLVVRETDGMVEAELEMRSGEAFNPLTRAMIDKVVFTVLGDRLIAIEPPELVGAPPIVIPHLTGATSIEDLVVKCVNDSLMQVQRRSQELASLGISVHVEPQTLLCTAELQVGIYVFTIGNDRMGNFRVMRANRAGVELTNATAQSFELSEFRERAALESYLAALFGEVPHSSGLPPVPAPAENARPVAEPEEVGLPTGELVAAFGSNANIAPRCQIEVVVDLQIGADRYRFAAVRLSGRSFRGMLAGAAGKVWADRFELDSFPGIRALVSDLLKVDPDKVQVVP